MQHLAHYNPGIWLVLAAGIAATDFSPLWPRPVATAAALALTAAGLVGVTAGLAHLYHPEHLCLRCGTSMAAGRTPCQVRRWCRRHHRVANRTALTLVMLAARFGLALPMWATAVLDAVASLSFVITGQAFLVHHANAAFCPYCGRGWGEDPDAPPEPVLDPTPPGKPATA